MSGLGAVHAEVQGSGAVYPGIGFTRSRCHANQWDCRQAQVPYLQALKLAIQAPTMFANQGTQEGTQAHSDLLFSLRTLAIESRLG